MRTLYIDSLIPLLCVFLLLIKKNTDNVYPAAMDTNSLNLPFYVIFRCDILVEVICVTRCGNTLVEVICVTRYGNTLVKVICVTRCGNTVH